MRGHEPILAMRRSGVTPQGVWIFDQQAYTDSTHPTRGWMVDTAQATVELLPTDNPARLDLRFCVGLTVYTQGTDADRLAALEAALLKAGADRVLGALLHFDGREHQALAMADTRGIIVMETEHGKAAA